LIVVGFTEDLLGVFDRAFVGEVELGPLGVGVGDGDEIGCDEGVLVEGLLEL
jgi:hypothetical protein